MLKENQETNPKILIVEDSEFEMQLAEWILLEENYEIIKAANGAEALEILKEERPDLILLDIMLPDTNGFDICRKIKSIDDRKDIPVIFCTSLADIEDIVRGYEAGGVDYIIKPFIKEGMLARVKNHFELYNNKRKIELQAQELMHANAMKDKMFSVISHDLRSPLGSIKLTLDFIASGLLKPDSELFNETINDLVNTTDEAYILLENLLGWAKSQSNTLKVLPEILDLKEIATRVVGLLKLSSENKKIKIDNRIAEHTDVLADMQMVQSVFRNLLSNALKFTPENGFIELSAILKETDVEISIKDSGVGISPENLEKIFDQKQSVKSFGTNNETGSGLGLVLCKDFAEKNGGTIWVESELGKGSTFTFTLPLA